LKEELAGTSVIDGHANVHSFHRDTALIRGRSDAFRSSFQQKRFEESLNMTPRMLAPMSQWVKAKRRHID
jgi:hypothetical protein